MQDIQKIFCQNHAMVLFFQKIQKSLKLSLFYSEINNVVIHSNKEKFAQNHFRNSRVAVYAAYVF